jgi:CheY-like chemotaxis protein
MGLAVLFGIVHSHGGTVTVESRLNEGTTFRVYLPKCSGEYREEVQSTAPPARGTERIMFVDDEKTMSDLVGEMLSGLGYAVTVFNDSAAALEAFTQDPSAFDLVFTDQTMPGLSGMQLAGEVRARRSDIPIILCTGFSRQVDEKSALIEGIDGFIRKPFRKRDVADRIRSVLQRKDNS